MTRRLDLLLLLTTAMAISLPLPAQVTPYILPPNQPEQDACGALPLCGGVFATPYSYQGQGKTLELPNTPCGSGEMNSMWLKVTVSTGGLMAFAITPKDPEDDYDFAVLNVTNIDCNNIGPGNVVRCNFNNNLPGSNPGGVVGLGSTGTTDFVQSGSTGNSFANPIGVTAGQTYLIAINNYGHDNSSGPSSGFRIDFSTSTAAFLQNFSLALKDIVKKCSDDTITVDISQPILCNSIAPDGSDFSLNSSVHIVGATGVNCIAAGYTSQIVIRLDGHLSPGDYILTAQKGTDGNTLRDICGSDMVLPSTLTVTIPPPLKGHFMVPDTTKCNYASIVLAPDQEFEKYQWSQGQDTRTIQATAPGEYRLTVTDRNGCVASDSTLVIDSACPQYVYLPSAFTPNGDGKNDLFRPVFAGAASAFRFVVFDRWGRAVFESSSPSGAWDGTTKGQRQPPGVYVWVCEYKLFAQPPRVQRGTVTLLR
jgi:gliding motility-associated-like protein